jgi:tRNA modification GTPase
MYADDTIAAIATPPGAGGIGIVRVSGPLALAIAASLFDPPREWESHHLYHGAIRDPLGARIDDSLAVVMRAPHSYTGEDVLELHCHGSPMALRRVLDAVLHCGARTAERGEFTRRAFLNGRLDLAQAEAVIELIRARNESGAALAAEQLFGRLSDALDRIRSALIEIRAQLEVEIDFSEEDVTVDQDALARTIDRTRADVLELLESYRHGKLIRDGIRVAITGKPNVGKSSLLNALLQEERAIVTAIPGTTRDVVEDIADFGGLPVTLSDTAGLRNTGDPIETIGVARARDKLAAADVVIGVFDGAQPLSAEDEAVLAAVADRPSVIALNKCDLPAALNPVDMQVRIVHTPVIRISAKTGAGLDELRRAVISRIDANAPDASRDAPTITLARHRDALEKAAASLALAHQGIQQRVAPDLVAVDIQAAADHIGGITGVITSEDVLEKIFAEFCIGK